jgi:hypothetical protein
VALVTVTVWAFTTPFVPPISVFEVDDGNSTLGDNPGNTTPACDWNTLNNNLSSNTTTPAGTCAGDTSTLGSYSFLVGTPGEGTFTGGSKDIQDVSSWSWASLGSPDKDALTHGYAAAYTVPAATVGDTQDHTVLVFGAERFATNGDANIGIWFFQQSIGQTGATKGGFGPGVHQDGDVFAVSAFTGGGTHPQLDVYEWHDACGTKAEPVVKNPVPGDCAAVNLKLIFSGGGAGGSGICNTSSPGCSSVNTADTVIGWPYESKFPTGTQSNTVPAFGFYEGGFDLTSIFPGTPPCFASFLVETRSSQAPTAELKDFLAGSFPQCHIKIEKACNCTAFSASKVEFTNAFGGTVTNDGGGTVHNVKVTDGANTYDCGASLSAKGKIFFGDATQQPGSPRCTLTTGTSDTFTSTTLPATNIATVVANTTSDPNSPTVGGSTGTVSCGTNAAACTPAPGLEVHKRCVTTLVADGGVVKVRVDYTGEVKNTGNVNVSANVAESAPNGLPSSASFGPFSLTPTQQVCYTNGAATCPTITPAPTVNQPVPTGAVSYFPNGFTNILPAIGGASAGRAEWEDSVTATGTDVYGHAIPPVGSPPIMDTGKCLICPFGYCPVGQNPPGTN